MQSKYGWTLIIKYYWMQAISRRVNYGKVMGEARFQTEMDIYEPLIKKQVIFFIFTLK